MVGYLGSLLWSWWAAIALIIGLVRLVEWQRGQPFSFFTTKRKLLLIVSLLVVAQYWAYRAKDREVVGLRDELRTTKGELESLRNQKPAVDLSRPQFRGELVKMMVGESVAVVEFVLINSGAPSIAHQWSIAITFSGSSTPTPLTRLKFEDKKRLTFQSANNPDFVIEVARNIDVLGSTPIPTGDYIRGVIAGGSDDIPRDRWISKGSTVHLSVQDSMGNPYRFDFRVG